MFLRSEVPPAEVRSLDAGVWALGVESWDLGVGIMVWCFGSGLWGSGEGVESPSNDLEHLRFRVQRI